MTSKLEDIVGIGPRRRASLLKHFGGLAGLKAAGAHEIARVEGINAALAEPGQGLVTLLAAANREMLHDMASRMASEASAQSVEGTLPVASFESGEVRGAYFSATDKSPPPGEFKYLSRGIAAAGGYAATFTALSHAEPEATRDAMLAVVKSLRVAPAR